MTPADGLPFGGQVLELVGAGWRKTLPKFAEASLGLSGESVASGVSGGSAASCDVLGH
jgi:hypothetical protein